MTTLRTVLLLSLILLPSNVWAFCSMPTCSDFTNPACQAQQQAYDNCKRLEQMEERQRQREWEMQQQQQEEEARRRMEAEERRRQMEFEQQQRELERQRPRQYDDLYMRNW